MKTIFLLLTLNVLLFFSSFQKKLSNIESENLLKLSLDSLEQRIIENDWKIDTAYYIYYTIENTSKDSLIFITNSCFYYNHYSLKINENIFDINSEGGCCFNSYKTFKIPPSKSIQLNEDIDNFNLRILKLGISKAKLKIPIIKDDKYIFRVDGRNFIKNDTYIIFRGLTKVYKTYTDFRKPRKKIRKRRKKIKNNT